MNTSPYKVLMLLVLVIVLCWCWGVVAEAADAEGVKRQCDASLPLATTLSFQLCNMLAGSHRCNCAQPHGVSRGCLPETAM